MVCVFCDAETASGGHGYDVCESCIRKIISYAQKQKYLRAYLADLSAFAESRHDDITSEQWSCIKEKILERAQTGHMSGGEIWSLL